MAEFFHDWSGLFIFFPVAVAAMTGFSNLLNADWGAFYRKWTLPDTETPATAGGSATPKPVSPVSYDY